MCAGTVVAPAGDTSAGMVSIDFQVEVGRLQGELALLGADQHVGEDRNRVAPLDHAVHVPDRFEERGALDGDLHVRPHSADEANAPASEAAGA